MRLETERLHIREFTMHDIDIVYEINNHPECIVYNGWNSMSYDECSEVLKRWIDQYKNHSEWGVFCVVIAKTNEKVGMTFLYDHDGSNTYEIGYRFKKSMWGNGFAQELTRAYFKYAKDILNSEMIYAEVDAHNTNSRRIFEKLKFDECEHPSGAQGILYKMIL